MIRTILSIASAVLLIASSGALVGFSVERESNARYTGLEVDVVEIDGMFFVDAAGVRDLIFANDSSSGTFVADLSLHDVERWVRDIPAIDGVEIYPGLNRTLHVQVTQRKPLARVHTSEDDVYVVSVSGPKQYDVKPDWDQYEATRYKAGENKQLFQVISIDGNTLSYKSYTAIGDLFDSFDLIKSENGINSLIND